MNFGKWVVVSFLLFAAFIGTLVTICVHQNVDLVSPNYYKEELVYQDQIERLNNTEQLQQKPVVKVVNNNSIQIEFNQNEEIQYGELKIFCPSNPEMDKNFKLLNPNVEAQIIELQGIQKGMYKVRLLWTMHGKEFYIEEVINI